MTDDAGFTLAAIQAAFPQLALDHVELYTGGQNSDILIVNGEWIFRFPRYDHVLAQMKTEISLLAVLKDRLPLAIPEPRWLHLDAPPGQAFMGYQRIPGEPLWRETFRSIRKLDILDGLAGQLGKFLRTLHRLSPADFPDIQLEASDSQFYYQDFYRRIKEKIFPLMRPDARQWAARHFETYLEDDKNFTYPLALRHGDFGASNLLYDARRAELTGVIDFSGTTFGDPAVDFAGLRICYGEDFIRRIQSTYPLELELMHRVRFYVGTFALEEALFGFENGDEAALQAGLEEYRI